MRFYQLFDSDDSLIGGFYFDLFARSGKRGGAWMSGFQARYRYDNEGYEQLPVCFMVGNFTPALAGKPNLLTHDEVLTLFHEFGHGLHHLLAQVNVGDVAGVNGVEWDAVELPSQFMENWAWDSEGIALISSHVETGEPLPQDKLDALLAAKKTSKAVCKRCAKSSLLCFDSHSRANARARLRRYFSDTKCGTRRYRYHGYA